MNRQDLNKKLNELEPYAKEAREQIKRMQPEAIQQARVCFPSASFNGPWGLVAHRAPLTEFKDFMVFKLSFALLKTQLIKEAYTYRSSNYMMRLKTTGNEYDENSIVIDVDLLNGTEKAEVIFFADSAEDKKVVEGELTEVLDGKSLQELLYEYMDREAENLSTCLDEDDYVVNLKKFIEEAKKFAATMDGKE